MTRTPTFMTRRSLLGGGAAFAALSAFLGREAAAATAAVQPYVLPEQWRRADVKIQGGYEVGAIYVFSDYFFLYYVTGPETAIRYGVGVGEEGRQFKGTATIQRKVEWPSWTPTANMIRRRPDLYLEHAAGMPGGPNNPLGARAMYLYRGGRDTMYRIHGTPAPQSVGQAISNGCIRMVNPAVEELYEMVPIGTRVHVA